MTNRVLPFQRLTRCWVIEGDDGPDDIGPSHYDNRRAARRAARESDYAPRVPVRELPHHCLVLDCDGCGELLADEDMGRIVHFESWADLRTTATEAGWREQEGRTLCADCLAAAPATADSALLDPWLIPRQAGPGQLDLLTGRAVAS